MRATLYVPYSNGDCVNGFAYEGAEIGANSYAKAMIEQYRKYRDGIDEVFQTRFTHNMSANFFNKERKKYNQQTYYYQPVECKVFDIDNKNETIDNLIKYFQTEEPFVVIIALLNLSSADESGELESDIKSWMKECVKINNCAKMTDEEKLKSLSKKSLKLKFNDSGSAAIFRNAKMINAYTRNKFALLVERVDFIKDIDSEKVVDNKKNIKK